jgi:hypothetical protein
LANCFDLECVTGKLKLENVVLKSSAFGELGLPITVVKGTAQIIEFEIPWKSIQSSPVVVTVKNLDVVLGPNTTELGEYPKICSAVSYEILMTMPWQTAT